MQELEEEEQELSLEGSVTRLFEVYSNEKKKNVIAKNTVTNFPKRGDDKKVSLRNSNFERFPLREAIKLKQDYPQIWNKGGNILGNLQFRRLRGIIEQDRSELTPTQDKAIRLREAWSARHYRDHRLAGVVAQIKWLTVGSRGIDHMRAVIREAKKKIDATGKIVSPGFIDMHTHSERNSLDHPLVENYLQQGVTTMVGGNCGSSPFPINDFINKTQSKGIGPNLALLIGHNTIRKEVMGTENRLANADELKDMKKLVENSMKEGAFGMSTGLKYIPGAYSNTDEVVELAKVVSKNNGFYATHMREEGVSGLIESVEEAINIGRKASIPVQISHHKAVGQPMWGQSTRTLQMVDDAIKEGIDVTVDQYPYTATSTSLTIIFPAWSLSGGHAALKKRLMDKKDRKKIKKGIIWNIVNDRGGGDPASIVISDYSPNPTLNGKNLAEVTMINGLNPTPSNAAEVLMDMVYVSNGRGIYHCLSEQDIEQIMKHPLVMHASDGGTVQFGKAKPHPRNYGTYPKILGEYVRDRKILSSEEAIRKMTNLPASVLGLKDRGLIKEGYWADIVIFDANKIKDNSTWDDPHQYPSGIDLVMVNGNISLERGVASKRLYGKVLTHAN